ncbi:MAG: aldo/keto reductase [Oscillospiraceae bacterium]
MEYVPLNTGAKMPLEGFGAMMFDPADAGKAEEVVYTAIKTGYRLIDTAASYMNEVQVGNAIRRAIEEGITTREELFVVSKLWVQDMTDEETATKAIDTSLSNLGLEYIDLYLEHQAMGDYFAAWRAMEKAYKAGKLKAIGVANFCTGRTPLEHTERGCHYP